MKNIKENYNKLLDDYLKYLHHVDLILITRKLFKELNINNKDYFTSKTLLGKEYRVDDDIENQYKLIKVVKQKCYYCKKNNKIELDIKGLYFCSHSIGQYTLDNPEDISNIKRYEYQCEYCHKKNIFEIRIGY